MTHLARRRLAPIQLRAGVKRPAVSEAQCIAQEESATSRVEGGPLTTRAAENLPLKRNPFDLLGF